MSRQTADAVTQTETTIETSNPVTQRNTADRPDVNQLTCPILSELFFDPVMSVPCGHLIESDAKDKLESPGRCPCCREAVLTWIPCPPTVKSMLESELKRALAFRDDAGNPVVTHNDIHFNMNQFAKMVNQTKVVDGKGKTTQQEGLKTPLGERYIELLENASNHLNDKAAEGTRTGKSPIEILAGTQSGHDLLRKKLTVQTIVETEATAATSGTNTSVQQYFFGNAEITSESLRIQVNGKSIREWLDPTVGLAMQEQQAREKIIAKQTAALRALQSQQRSHFRLFADARTADQVRPQCEVVNELLQLVVYGQRIKVREKLDQLKRENSALLKMVLTSTATTTIVDYSGKKIENMTLLQAAHAAGDVSLHPELIASDMNHQGMCEIIRSYFDANDQADQAEIDTQCRELFPNGFEACVAEQEQKAKDFHLLDLMLDAISNASPEQLTAALNLNGARFDEADDATRGKPFEQLSFVEKHNRFREVSAKRFLRENVSNPYYLLRAIELFDAFCYRCERDASIDPTLDKQKLFWRQIIGFIQRFVPARTAQAFSQGLYSLVKVGQDVSWRPEVLKDDFEFKHDRGIHFYPLSDSCSGLGFNYAAVAMWGGGPAGRWGRAAWCCGRLDFYKNLFRTKTAVSQNLCHGGELTHTTSQINVVAR